MVQIADKLPDRFKRVAYHPSAFVYAWKKNVLEKLFNELMESDIAIKSFEVWVMEEGIILKNIPLKTGKVDIFEGQHSLKKNEEWYDFVERTCKETLETIN